MAGTVVILGAGATRSVHADAPLTADILPRIMEQRNAPWLQEFTSFLSEVFHVAPGAAKEQYPGLPLLMSLLDTALDRKQALQGIWDVNGVARMRQAIECGIFEVLEDILRKAPTTNHYHLLQKIYPGPHEPCIISLNYDLIMDTSMMYYSQSRGAGGLFPNYGIDIQTEFYRNATRCFGKLLKLHGSINWLYCKTCHRIEIGSSASTKYIQIMGQVLGEHVMASENALPADGSKCPACMTALRPLLIAPTHLKDYRNPHLTQVWYQAERVLRECNRAVIVGYSLPDDDIEVVYLFKRALAHLSPRQITVVQKDDSRPRVHETEVGRRYRALFGDVDWQTGDGLNEWLRQPLTAAQDIGILG